MRRVIIESPFGGNPQKKRKHVRYARMCMQDSLRKGEAPFLSHLLYPQVLNDDDPIERYMGIEAGLLWRSMAEATIVYTDLGITRGMEQGVSDAHANQRPIVYRKLWE